jgi:hypothetical protein
MQISVGVVTEAETAEESQSENAAKANAVKAAMLAKGVAEEDVQTTYYSVYPITESRKVCPEGNPDCESWEATWVTEVVGYRTSHTMRIETKDLDSAGDVIDGAVAAGANNINSITFTLQDETRKEIEEELIAEAMEDAQDEAESIASGLGVSIGDVVHASLGGSYYPVTRDYYAAEMAAAPGGTEFSPGQLTVSVSGQVEFEIVQ